MKGNMLKFLDSYFKTIGPWFIYCFFLLFYVFCNKHHLSLLKKNCNIVKTTLKRRFPNSKPTSQCSLVHGQPLLENQKGEHTARNPSFPNLMARRDVIKNFQRKVSKENMSLAEAARRKQTKPNTTLI